VGLVENVSAREHTSREQRYRERIEQDEQAEQDRGPHPRCGDGQQAEPKQKEKPEYKHRGVRDEHDHFFSSTEANRGCRLSQRNGYP